MKSAYPFLGPALVLSIFLHAAAIVLGARLVAPAPGIAQREPAEQVELSVRLHDRLVEPDPAPALLQLLPPVVAARHATAPVPSRAAAPRPQSAPPQRLGGDAALKAAEQLARNLPYPRQAIEQGLEGEALVLLFLDSSGNAVAARLESSSGHAVLDDAAVRAARLLRSLPDSAPREALLPVRFRLR